MTEFPPVQTAAPSIGDNLRIFTVSEIAQAVKRAIEGKFERVRVRGEISGFRRAGSGHCYMALKDEDAVLDAVCWRGTVMRLGLEPQDGLEVVATGRLTTYPGRSKYQMVLETLELAGEGALLKLLEDRKRKLAAEGLFDTARKRPLPFLPGVIGVVTSPSGAVIRDILHRVADRFPRHVLVWPVLVQGEDAAAQVVAAIDGFNRLAPEGPVPRPELLIVARGGGSLEDLWAFNEEIVVRAAAASAIPLISAVGHETDTTLIDFAADRRAPTPTAAAEMAVPVRAEVTARVLDCSRRMLSAAERMVSERRTRVEGLARGLPHPARLLEENLQRLDDRMERLRNAVANLLRRHGSAVAEWGARLPHPRQQLRLSSEQLANQGQRLAVCEVRLTERPRQEFERVEAARRLRQCIERFMADKGLELKGLGRLLETTSHRNVLNRGFALVRGSKGIVTRSAQVLPGDALEIEFADGPTGAIADAGTRPRPRRGTSDGPAKDAQGKLL
jgi:exodeoxyribonuclease VII large subunit